MFLILENGKIVRGFVGIFLEGLILFVGYYMLLGFELVLLVVRILKEKNIILRGMVYLMMFYRLKDGKLFDLLDYDNFRLMGVVFVLGINLFKLFVLKFYVLLYLGGMREVFYRKVMYILLYYVLIYSIFYFKYEVRY